MTNPEPQAEHQWLHKLVGDWTCEFECDMGPDQPKLKQQGTASVRSLGGLWTITEGEGEMPGGGISQSVLTIGYDPAKQAFLGSFIASCMTHFWIYENGALDAAGKVLTLNAEGPSFTGEGMSKYQDMIEFIDDDHHTLSSRVQGPDGAWTHFMTGHYYRKK